MKKSNYLKLAIAGLLCAVAVVGSMLQFPFLGSQCAPVQHMVNILCAVLLGPWYGFGVAFAASLIRNLTGLGSLLAFPGSMLGALVCGLVYAKSKNILATLLGWFIRFRPDIVIAPSPPLTIGLNAWAIAAVRRARYVYNVQEIYPDIAVNLGVMKNKLLIRFFGWLERLIYRKAARVTSITRTMCAKIATRTCPEKVCLVPNFVDLSDVVTCPRDNAFAAEHGLGGKFVLTYAGNMGIPQRLDVMIELARRLPSLTVLLVGGGGDAARLKVLAEGVPNVKFVDYQPISRMPEIYAASDLFYVGQDASACSDGIPSKIYRILGYRKPLAVMTQGDSDLAGFVRQSKGGVLLDEDMDAAARAVAELMGDPARLASYGENGRRFVTESFDRASVSRRYEEICREAVEESNA